MTLATSVDDTVELELAVTISLKDAIADGSFEHYLSEVNPALNIRPYSPPVITSLPSNAPSVLETISMQPTQSPLPTIYEEPSASPTGSYQPSMSLSPSIKPSSYPSQQPSIAYYYSEEIIIAVGILTSEMEPYRGNCNYEDGSAFVHVRDQCQCSGEVMNVPQDVLEMRCILLENLVPIFYSHGTYNETVSSCEPSNMALLWLSSGNNRDAGEIRQRFVLALSFFALNGTMWDSSTYWLDAMSECLWLGVECNSREVIKRLALDANNVVGSVSVALMSSLREQVPVLPFMSDI